MQSLRAYENNLYEKIPLGKAWFSQGDKMRDSIAIGN